MCLPKCGLSATLIYTLHFTGRYVMLTLLPFSPPLAFAGAEAITLNLNTSREPIGGTPHQQLMEIPRRLGCFRVTVREKANGL